MVLMISLDGMTAQQWYNRVIKKAARDYYDALAEREWALETCQKVTQAYGGMVGGHGPHDTPAALRYVLGVEELDADIEALAQVINEGTELAHGVGKLAGRRSGAIIVRHYIWLEEWKTIASEMNLSVRQAQRLMNSALEMIDALGVAHVLAGKGIAEQ